jgi:DNA-binding transcriptional MocR family regulator
MAAAYVTSVNAAWQLLARSGAIHADGRRGTVVAEPRATGPRRYRSALRQHASFALDLSTARTVHIRSLSKSHGPDLRLAAVGGPAAILDLILERRLLGQGWTSRLLQHLPLDLLQDPACIAAVSKARREYARRRRLVGPALARTSRPARRGSRAQSRGL